MLIRKTQSKDIEDVLELFEQARQFMKANGNPNQWTNGHPHRNIIKQDIEDNKSYVCLDNDVIVGTFYFSVEDDPTYSIIDHGSWLNNKPYGVIHRIATHTSTKGIGSYCINWCFDQCGNIRVDTHVDNIPMDRLLIKCGFTKCGIIYIRNGDERVAYQKSL